MADRQVTRTDKDSDGDILALCNPISRWSPRQKSDAISDIETGSHSYYVRSSDGSRVNIIVVEETDGKHLRTEPNSKPQDNLDNLPDC